MPQILYASGFNAHNQLILDPVPSSSPPKDLHILRPLTTSTNPIKILSPSWSSHLLSFSSHLHLLGHPQPRSSLILITPPSFNSNFSSYISSTSTGLIGAICKDTGHLYVLKPVSKTGKSDGDSTLGLGLETYAATADDDNSEPGDFPALSHLAISGNGQVMIIIKPSPGAGLFHILGFTSWTEFLAWYDDPSGSKKESQKEQTQEQPPNPKHFMIPGQPHTLTSSTTTFTLLLSSGEIYTWGDGRHYQCLGRSPQKAQEPGQIDALGGICIKKIASKGWISAALSQDGAVYVWGRSIPPGSSGLPGSEEKGGIKCLEGEEEEVKLVEVLGDEDVRDMSVGDGHIVLVTESGKVWGVGENGNGQLGLGESAEGFVENWTEIGGKDLLGNVTSVECGDKNTFLISESNS